MRSILAAVVATFALAQPAIASVSVPEPGGLSLVIVAVTAGLVAYRIRRR